MRRFFFASWLSVLLFVISTIIGVLSETSFVDVFLKETLNVVDVSKIKNTIKAIDFLLFILPLGIQSIVRGARICHAKELKKKYGQRQRGYVYAILSEKGYIEGGSENDFNIRIFKKRFAYLVSKDEDGFCGVPINRPLFFSIKREEGLCVKAYIEKKSQLEIEDASKKEYNLNNQQLASAGNLKFIVAVPVCGATSNEKIKYVICFDSFTKIGRPQCCDQVIKVCENIAYDLADVLL